MKNSDELKSDTSVIIEDLGDGISLVSCPELLSFAIVNRNAVEAKREGDSNKTCDNCAWSSLHSLESYGKWRCDYHGFHTLKAEVPELTCEEWRKEC